MTTKVYCDICDRDITDSKYFAHIIFESFSKSHQKVSENEHRFELCHNCKYLLDDFCINGLRLKVSEQEI